MPYRLQDLRLSFGGRSAVAPHRGYDKRHRASRFQIIAYLPDDERKVVDSAAAGANRNAGAWPNETIERRELWPQGGRRIVEACSIEPLPDFMEPHGLQYRYPAVLRYSTSAP